MRVVELKSREEIEAIAGPWEALVLASAHETPYMLPEYLLPWMRRLEDRHAYRFLSVWQGARLVGLAPLMWRRIGGHLFNLRLLVSPEIVPTPPCEFLLDPDAEGVAQAMLEHWAACRDWDAISLAGWPGGAPGIAEFAAEAADIGLGVQQIPEHAIYYVAVKGSWDQYHASRRKTLRGDLRRGQRYFDSLGNQGFVAYPGVFSLSQARAALLDVLAHSWKGDQEGEGWNVFWGEVFDGFAAKNMLRATFMTVSGKPVAYILDVPFKGSVYGLFNGYDQRVGQGSPGHLMLAHVLRLAHDDGIARYVTGARDYYRYWGNDQLNTFRLRITRTSLASRLRLYVYDYGHKRRLQDAIATTEAEKDARKRARTGDLVT